MGIITTSSPPSKPKANLKYHSAIYVKEDGHVHEHGNELGHGDANGKGRSTHRHLPTPTLIPTSTSPSTFTSSPIFGSTSDITHIYARRTTPTTTTTTTLRRCSISSVATAIPLLDLAGIGEALSSHLPAATGSDIRRDTIETFEPLDPLGLGPDEPSLTEQPGARLGDMGVPKPDLDHSLGGECMSELLRLSLQEGDWAATDTSGKTPMQGDSSPNAMYSHAPPLPPFHWEPIVRESDQDGEMTLPAEIAGMDEARMLHLNRFLSDVDSQPQISSQDPSNYDSATDSYDIEDDTRDSHSIHHSVQLQPLPSSCPMQSASAALTHDNLVQVSPRGHRRRPGRGSRAITEFSTVTSSTAMSRSSVLVLSKGSQPSIGVEEPSDDEEFEQPRYGLERDWINCVRREGELWRKACESDQCWDRRGRNFSHIIFEDGGLASTKGEIGREDEGQGDAAELEVEGENEGEETRGLPFHVCEDCYTKNVQAQQRQQQYFSDCITSGSFSLATAFEAMHDARDACLPITFERYKSAVREEHRIAKRHQDMMKMDTSLLELWEEIQSNVKEEDYIDFELARTFCDRICRGTSAEGLDFWCGEELTLKDMIRADPKAEEVSGGDLDTEDTPVTDSGAEQGSLTHPHGSTATSRELHEPTATLMPGDVLANGTGRPLCSGCTTFLLRLQEAQSDPSYSEREGGKYTCSEDDCTEWRASRHSGLCHTHERSRAFNHGQCIPCGIEAGEQSEVKIDSRILSCQMEDCQEVTERRRRLKVHFTFLGGEHTAGRCLRCLSRSGWWKFLDKERIKSIRRGHERSSLMPWNVLEDYDRGNHGGDGDSSDEDYY